MSQPLSSAERKKRFIEKLKASGNYNEYLQKQAEIERNRRQRQKEYIARLSDSAQSKVLRKIRSKNLATKLKYRRRKKLDSITSGRLTPDTTDSLSWTNSEHDVDVEPDPLALDEPENLRYIPKTSRTKLNFEHAYNTDSALVKALASAKQALPKSPSKRKAIIAKLLYSLDEQSQKDIVYNMYTTNYIEDKGNDATSWTQEVHRFYERDDISLMSANNMMGMVDPITGEDQIIQLRFMVYTLEQAYDLFIAENPHSPIKFSKFCLLRPVHVKPYKKKFDASGVLEVDLIEIENVPCDSLGEDG